MRGPFQTTTTGTTTSPGAKSSDNHTRAVSCYTQYIPSFSSIGQSICQPADRPRKEKKLEATCSPMYLFPQCHYQIVQRKMHRVSHSERMCCAHYRRTGRYGKWRISESSFDRFARVSGRETPKIKATATHRINKIVQHTRLFALVAPPHLM